jgi:hypothetical protein
LSERPKKNASVLIVIPTGRGELNHDVGRREVIGLAATAQIAILPVWFSVSFVFGFPALDSATPRQRSLLVNVATIIATTFATYALLRMRGEGLGRFTESSAGSAD